MDGNPFILALVLGPLSILGGFGMLRRRRQIQNVPTSRARSMAAGPVELVGRVDSEPFLVSPLTRLPCAWWSYAIDEYVGGKNPWRRIESGDSSDCPLRLIDQTGVAVVDLTGFDVTPTHDTTRRARRNDPRAASMLAAAGVRSAKRLRIHEERIDAGDEILLHGVVRVGTHVEPTRFRAQVLERSRERATRFTTSAVTKETGVTRPSPRALARRLRKLKRERIAEKGGVRLDAEEFDALRRRAREQIEAERGHVAAALNRLAAISDSCFPPAFEPGEPKLEPAQRLMAALLLGLPSVPETVVGDDPLAQTRCFVLPGDETRALRNTRFGLAAVVGGILLFAVGLIGTARRF